MGILCKFSIQNTMMSRKWGISLLDFYSFIKLLRDKYATYILQSMKKMFYLFHFVLHILLGHDEGVSFYYFFY